PLAVALVVSPTLDAARFDAPGDEPAWRTYPVGAPPLLDAFHVRKTGWPLTLAPRLLGGAGGPMAAAAGAPPPSGRRPVLPVAPHAGLIVVEKIEPAAAELTRHDHDRTTESPPCAATRAEGTKTTAAATMPDTQARQVTIARRAGFKENAP